MEHMSKILMTSKVKKHIGFHYLLTEMGCVLWFFWSWTYYPTQDVVRKINDKSITHRLFRIQSENSILSGFYCIASIKYMIAETTLLEYTNLFFPNDYQNVLALDWKVRWDKKLCLRRNETMI